MRIQLYICTQKMKVTSTIIILQFLMHNLDELIIAFLIHKYQGYPTIRNSFDKMKCILETCKVKKKKVYEKNVQVSKDYPWSVWLKRWARLVFDTFPVREVSKKFWAQALNRYVSGIGTPDFRSTMLYNKSWVFKSMCD